MTALPVSYVPPPESKLVRFLADPDFVDMLNDCVRLWKIHAKAREENPKAIDVSHYIRSTLLKAFDKEFTEYGGRPRTPEAWAKIEAAVQTAVSKSKK